MKVKKVPLRMCLGCGEMKPKKELIRVVKNKEGEYNVDLSGKQNGRGAYICRSTDCFNKARKAKRFEKKFEGEIPDDVYNRLLQELGQNNG
jgi:predicted RNA-binding protein YlxR (DUF448 family)